MTTPPLLVPLRIALSAFFWKGERAILTTRRRVLLAAITVAGMLGLVIEGFGIFALMAVLFRGSGKPITVGMLVGVPAAQQGVLAAVVSVRVVFALVFGRMLLHPGLEYLLQCQQHHVAHRLRMAIVRGATRLPALNAGVIPSGELSTIINEEVTHCSQAFTSISEGVQLLGGVALSMFFLIARDPGLNAAAIAAAAPVLIIYALVASHSSKESRALVAARIAAGKDVTESLRSLAGIQAAGGGPGLMRSLARTVGDILFHEVRFQRNHGILRYLMTMIPIVAGVGAFSFAWFVRGAHTPAALGAILMPTAIVGGRIAAAGSALVTNLYMSSVNVNSFVPVKGLLDRLAELGRHGRRPDDVGDGPLPRLAAVRLEACSFRLPNGSWLFRDVTLALVPGHPLVVRGASGTGKSTLASLVAGANDPTEGRVVYVLEDGAEVGPHDRFLNYLSQDPAVMAGTIRSNLLLGAEHPIGDDALVAALRRARLWDELGPKGGLDAAVFEGARNLSGGQIRRLGLARLFTREKGLWIFDEATASLDAEAAGVIEEVIRQICATRLALVISHDVDFRIAGTELHLAHNAPVKLVVAA
jgi:ABC-type transport system involved in cytochrome bd biosynthesis fused ATPase/permease subunit